MEQFDGDDVNVVPVPRTLPDSHLVVANDFELNQSNQKQTREK